MTGNTERSEIKHVLVISDESDRLDTLEAVFNLHDVKVDSATTLEEVRRQCEMPHDMALVDFSASQLAQVLDQLRKSPSNREIPVLVNIERTEADMSLAGVLPRFRAMPCSPHQMSRFTRQQFAPQPRWTSEIAFL